MSDEKNLRCLICTAQLVDSEVKKIPLGRDDYDVQCPHCGSVNSIEYDEE